jgi:hypothetical protein
VRVDGPSTIEEVKAVDENPYASPHDSRSLNPKLTIKLRWRQAKLAWLFPTCAILVVAIVVVLDAEDELIGQLATPVVWTLIFCGVLYTTLDFAFRSKYLNTLRNAIAGMAALIAFSVLFVTMIVIREAMTRQDAFF